MPDPSTSAAVQTGRVRKYIGRHRLNRDCQRHGHAWGGIPDFTDLQAGAVLARYCERCPAIQAVRVARTVREVWASDEPISPNRILATTTTRLS